MLARLGLVGLVATCASGAYVQWQDCGGHSSKTDVFVPQSLRATLEPSDDGRQNQLTLQVGRWMEEAECQDLARRMPYATLEFEMLGRSAAYQTTTKTTCEKLNFSKNWRSSLVNPFSLHLSISEDIGRLPPLSTFHTTLHLEGNDSEEISCRQANITPALSSTVTAIVTYSTWAIFLFVLLVGILRSTYSTPIALDDEDDEEQRSIRTVLPNVGDCLQYLQFIFLTGGLSLRYPGFYQPVVSHLNLFSLFMNGPVTHGVVYDRVEDGIYVLNGTYGGTYGLELMTQIAGAPMTMDTWLNMVVLMFIIAFGVAMVLEVVWFMKRSHDLDSEFSRSAGGMRYTASRVLRGILSYFMFPLAALSFYQLDNASILPAYHTSMAVALILAMMAAFIWLIRKIPTRSLGVLVFDSTKRYRQLRAVDDARRRDGTFIFVLFALTFVRGAAVGGLQISGPAQLAVLGACELVLLASIAGFQAYSTFSIGSIAATIRLCSLIFLVAFLPGLATPISVKSAIGYLLLAVHGGMLLLGFFVPALCELSKLVKGWWTAPRPEIYGLRQLRRREVSRTNLASMYTSSMPDTSYPEPNVVESPNAGYLRPTYRSDSPSTMHLASSTTSSRYFRPPRSSASISSVENPRSLGSSLYTTSTPSRTTSTSTTFIDKHSVQRSESIVSPSRLSESTEEESRSTSQRSPTRPSDGPLGPRWNDYSFREADLYYNVPRPPPVERASEELPRPPAPRPSFRSSSGLWARVTGQSGTGEQGFQVVRPRPASEQGFVVVRPNRPSNLGNGAPGAAPSALK
ncbi:integral membrane protein [Colletotrichum limetticola]|uniref:Integral membrane protein n=1 Tax=Colletotrichum limetticola TaxID=1209924 RepID=A0ABQ9PD76_9PEZI|nr:integral membrane protein [Colletotrichum limetticola]